MQQSNAYIIVFTLIMTIFFGSVLSFTRMKLDPIQKKQIEIDTKKKILGAAMDVSSLNPDEILSTYNDKMNSVVVDINGEIAKHSDGSDFTAEDINIMKNFKMKPSERKYPVFMFSSTGEKTEYFIFPMHGNGLWDWISGFVALDNELNRIVGVAFDHKQETPGLGARITSDEIQNRYKGKQIFDDDNRLISVNMLKAEKNNNLTVHQVDGMSGATITANGLNSMLMHYFECYKPFIEKNKKEFNKILSYNE